jgi:hypothetical protein
MTDIGDAGALEFGKVGLRLRSVENAMTTIDSFLAPNLAIDLAKIDVEGHEPFVMRGMTGTIARSPRLRFIIEYNDGFLAHTVPAPQFLDEIHGLGFRVLKILRNMQLELIEPSEVPTGHFELLLTRTPEEDMRIVATQRRRLRARFKRWLRRTARDARDFWYRG